MISRARSIGALSLIALWGLVSTACTTQPQPVTTAEHGDACAGIKNHNIEVGDRVSCKWVFVKTNEHGYGNTVNWEAKDKTMGIKVWFDEPNLFPDLNCAGDQSVCESKKLKETYKGDSSVGYTYHASLCPGKDKTKCGPDIDPGIIIVP